MEKADRAEAGSCGEPDVAAVENADAREERINDEEECRACIGEVRRRARAWLNRGRSLRWRCQAVAS